MVESAPAEVTAGGMAPVEEQHSPKPQPQSRPAQKRRRSSMADLTGRLLMDDSVEGLAMLAQPGSAGGLAPPSSPQDSPAGRGGPAGWQRWRFVLYLELCEVDPIGVCSPQSSMRSASHLIMRYGPLQGET